jgi:hypothetical protein
MNNLRRRLSNSFIIRFLLLFAFGWALLQLLVYFETVIIIFTFAAILAALLTILFAGYDVFYPILVFLVSFLIVIP